MDVHVMHEDDVVHGVVAYALVRHGYKFAWSINHYDPTTFVPHVSQHRD